MDLFPTPAPDHELQSALRRLVEVRMLDMDVEEGVAGGQDLRAGHEVDGLERQHRRGLAEAAPDPALVAELTLRRHHRHERKVVHPGVVPAGRTATERDVDALGHPGVEPGGPAEDGVLQHAGIGMAVKRLLEADPGVGTRHDPPHGVATGRARREPQAADLPEHGRHVPGVHVVQLDLLAGREVDPSARVVVGDACQAAGRVRLEDAPDADADHEHARLCLGTQAVHLEGVALLGGQPLVSLGCQAVEVDRAPGPVEGRRAWRRECRGALDRLAGGARQTDLPDEPDGLELALGVPVPVGVVELHVHVVGLAPAEAPALGVGFEFCTVPAVARRDPTLAEHLIEGHAVVELLCGLTHRHASRLGSIRPGGPGRLVGCRRGDRRPGSPTNRA